MIEAQIMSLELAREDLEAVSNNLQVLIANSNIDDVTRLECLRIQKIVDVSHEMVNVVIYRSKASNTPEIDKINVQISPKHQCILIRDVTKKECDWLDDTIKVNSIVYVYNGPTYGCITPGNAAFTFKRGETPFFELPFDSVRKVKP